jgi:hypothetical protein
MFSRARKNRDTTNRKENPKARDVAFDNMAFITPPNDRPPTAVKRTVKKV